MGGEGGNEMDFPQSASMPSSATSLSPVLRVKGIHRGSRRLVDSGSTWEKETSRADKIGDEKPWYILFQALLRTGRTGPEGTS